MAIHELLEQLQSTGFATAIREGTVYFPMIECVHVLALTFVIGSIAMVDLRLLGLTARDQPVSRLTKDILPWTWGAFVVAAIFGFLLFSSEAAKYVNNGPFRLKMMFIALAGINMLAFHFLTYRGVAKWDLGVPTPLPAKVAGGLSLLLWVCVVASARWIGFTMFG